MSLPSTHDGPFSSMASGLATAKKPQHGYPHLAIIKESIRLLYKQISFQKLKSFAPGLEPSQVSSWHSADIIIAVQSLAGLIVRHLQLPKGCILVNFRAMDNPGRVELTPEDTYLVDLHAKYRDDHRDIAAVLAHEITHVFLHRHGIRWPDTFDNEILTDTASVYLGVGWLCLNAHRVTASRQQQFRGLMRETRITTTEESLGYLTPEEFAYVLGKRAIAFGDKLDGLITSPAAKVALKKGYRRAVSDHHAAPVAGCGWWRRWRYCRDRRYIRATHQKTGLSGSSRPLGPLGGYHFEIADSMRVVFDCPVCSQKLRLPTDTRLTARCAVCESSFECRT